MKTKPPPNRRKFAGDWDKIGHLYDKLLYWLYQRENARRALPFAERLRPLLSKVAREHEAIFGEECWSLLHEVKGDLAKAIEHRENEIRLIRRLHQVSRNTPGDQPALDGYGYDDLSDRLDLLAVLYYRRGDLDKAIRTLQESKQLCEKHGAKFDGVDLLRDYLQEKRDLEGDSDLLHRGRYAKTASRHTGFNMP